MYVSRTGTERSPVRPRQPGDGPRGEGRGVLVHDERTGEVRLAHSTEEAGEQGGTVRCGVGGGKGQDQGEGGAAKHSPDSEPGCYVTSAESPARSCKQERNGEA